MEKANVEKPKWHNIIRDEIKWHPTVDSEMCIGCGLCVLGCGTKVYKFNFEQKKAVVVAPSNCKVGCVTCENTCPAYAISFPPLTYLHKIMKTNQVLTTSKKELEVKRNEISYDR